MIEKVVSKQKLSEQTSRQTLEYWLGQPPQARIAAVEYLRNQYYGSSARLQRVVRIIQLEQS